MNLNVTMPAPAANVPFHGVRLAAFKAIQLCSIPIFLCLAAIHGFFLYPEHKLFSPARRRNAFVAAMPADPSCRASRLAKALNGESKFAPMPLSRAALRFAAYRQSICQIYYSKCEML